MRTSRYAGVRAVAMAISSAALLAAAAGCSAGASTPPASALAGLTASQIFNRALADLKTASSVHVAGSFTSGGQPMTMNMTLGASGCTGTLSSHGQGSVAVLGIGSRIWVKPDRQYLKSNGATSAQLNTVTGKYLRTSGSGSGGIAAFCLLSQFASEVGTPGSVVKGTTTTLLGQPVLQIKDTAQQGSAYVTISATPEIVRIDSAGIQMDFTNYNAPLALTAPPAGQVIDGSKYGF